MEDARLVGKNALFMTIALIADRVAQFAVIVLLARYLGPTNYGVYTFAMSFALMVSSIVNLSFRGLLTREVARDPTKADRFVSSTFTIRILTSVVAFALIAILVTGTKDAPSVIYAVYLSALIVILFSFGEFFQSVFVTFERMEYTIWFIVCLRALSLVGVVVVIFLGGGLLSLLIALSGAHLLALVFAFLFAVRKFVHLTFDIDLRLWKSLIKQALPFLLIDAFVPIFTLVDRVILSYLANDTAVGEYAAAATIAMAFLFISISVSTASYPAISRLYGEDNGAALAICRACFKYLLAITLPIAIAISLLAPAIIKAIYGSSYLGSIPALRVLAFSFLFTSFGQLLGLVSMAIRQERAVALREVMATGVNITLNLVLIPVWGIIGAATASLITAIFLFLTHYWLVRRALGTINFHQVAPPPLVAGAALGSAIYFLQNGNAVLSGAVGGMVYLGTLYLTKFATTEEIVLFKKVFWTRKI